MSLCRCGCGRVAPIVKESCAKRGLVAGQPYRFIHGHNTRKTITPAERLWERVNKTDSCWLWTGATSSANYGQIRFAKDKCVLTHRLAWEVTKGAIPDGLYVLHRCDNPPCCNPDHLFLGTAADNTADMMAKGRHWTMKGMTV